MSNPVLVATARVARASKRDSPPDDLVNAQRGLTFAKAERAIEQALAAEPRLTLEQCNHLASLFASAGHA